MENRQTKRLRLTYYHLSEGPENPWEEIPSLKAAFIPPIDNALVIKDAAASFGSRVHGKLIGTFADIAFFSFDSTKLINVPLKGGFIAVRDCELFTRINNLYGREIKSMPGVVKLRILVLGGILVCLCQPLLYRIFHWLRFDLTGHYTAETPTVHQHRTEFYVYDLANWQAAIARAQVAAHPGPARAVC